MGHFLLGLGSGWLCYPGKLKLGRGGAGGGLHGGFRMALLSGEVETCQSICSLKAWRERFRMALLSGEVETVVWPGCHPATVRVPDGFAIRGS